MAMSVHCGLMALLMALAVFCFLRESELDPLAAGSQAARGAGPAAEAYGARAAAAHGAEERADSLAVEDLTLASARRRHTSLRIFEQHEVPIFDPPSGELGGLARGRNRSARPGGAGAPAPPDDTTSYLIAVAAFGDGREAVRRVFLRNVAGLCAGGLQGALLVDAVAQRPSFWERALSSPTAQPEQGGAGSAWARGAGRWPSTAGEGFELGCAGHPFQVGLRLHAPSVGDLLTAAHHGAFWANRLRFGHFCYVEDDLGWTVASLFALQAELARLDQLALSSGALPLSRAARADARFPGLAAASAGVWTGLVRWEAMAGAVHLNDPANRTGGLAALNRVPLGSIAPNDLNWRPASGFVSAVHAGSDGEGGGNGARALFFEPANPFAASWLLPRPLLLRAWAGGRLPAYNGQPSMAKEYYGGCWLLAQAYARSSSTEARPFGPLRKLLPCDEGRLSALLAMHISDSKYTLGDGRRHSVVRSMAQSLRAACGRPAVRLGTAEWRALDSDAAVQARRRQKRRRPRQGPPGWIRAAPNGTLVLPWRLAPLPMAP